MCYSAGFLNNPVLGLTLRNVRWQPYGLMLLMMVPLIAYAGTADFLAAYRA